MEDNRAAVPSILSKVTFFNGDKVLMVIVPILFVLSALVVYSSVAKMGYAHMGTETNAIFTKHLVVIILAAATLMGCYFMGAKFLYKIAPYVYGICWLLTLGVYFFGSTNGGAARWYDFGFSVQPSELLKVATILLLARTLDDAQPTIGHQRLLPSFNPWKWTKKGRKKQLDILWNGTCKIVMPVLASVAVIIKAHNSTALLVFGIGLIMIFIGRALKMELTKVFLLVAAAGAIYYAAGVGRAHTATNRITNFVKEWTSPADTTATRTLTDADHAMIAIYDGGLFGVGAGQSVMRAKITHPESDYIFSFFVEEYGIIMGMILIILYAWIFARAIAIFRSSRWFFGGILVLGLALMITIQALLHFMVSTHLFIETGQNLPLISHGGTSMICTAAALGIILSISRQANNRTLEPPVGTATMTAEDNDE